MKYRTESRKEKRERLKKEAAEMKDKKEGEAQKEEKRKPVMAKFGLNHVTSLVENNKAKLVVIAHNVEPIELVLHLPTLCRKKDIPYCFVKGNSSVNFRHGKTRQSCPQEAHHLSRSH